MIIAVKVIAKASEDRIIGLEGDTLKIKCRAVPEKGRANETVIALVAKHYNVPKSSVKILKGANNSKKLLEILL